MTLKAVLERIEFAKKAANRTQDTIRLVAVSKTQSNEAIEQVYLQGQRDFAENYVEELVLKAKYFEEKKDVRWTFIGQLQSNKIQKLVAHADEIQTIASQKHARYVQRYAQEFHKKDFPVWIHVNAADEAQKYGVGVTEAEDLARFIQSECSSLKLQGIMVIPPAEFNDVSYPDKLPKVYIELGLLAKKIGLGKLSLGMSSDLSMAIRAGSDCVRIGTALFGPR